MRGLIDMLVGVVFYVVVVALFFFYAVALVVVTGLVFITDGLYATVSERLVRMSKRKISKDDETHISLSHERYDE